MPLEASNYRPRNTYIQKTFEDNAASEVSKKIPYWLFLLHFALVALLPLLLSLPFSHPSFSVSRNI